MESYSIGRVYSRAFTLARGTLASVGLLLLLVHLASMGLQWAFSDIVTNVSTENPGDPMARMAAFRSFSTWPVMIASVILSSLSLAGSVHGMLAFADRGETSFSDCLRAGLAKFLPMIGLLILWYIGIILGFALLIVPGIILVAMWSAAVPAMVGENQSVFASFGRSRELTRGMRMSIFVTWLLYVIVLYVMLFAALMSILGTDLAQLATAMNRAPVVMIVMIPIGVLLNMVMNALMTSVYLETLLVKEGGRSAHLVDVFE